MLKLTLGRWRSDPTKDSHERDDPEKYSCSQYDKLFLHLNVFEVNSENIFDGLRHIAQHKTAMILIGGL